MTSTTSLTHRIPRLTSFALLALAVGLILAFPGVAGAKKHSRATCSGAHAKSHKAKAKYKRCVKARARRKTRGSTTNGSGTQTGAQAGVEAAGCREQQEVDPDGFAETYGTEDAMDNCVQQAKDGSQNSSGADDSADDSG